MGSQVLTQTLYLLVYSHFSWGWLFHFQTHGKSETGIDAYTWQTDICGKIGQSVNKRGDPQTYEKQSKRSGQPGTI